MTRVGRWIKRALLLALLAFVALQSWYLLHIFYWRYADPHMTSFMEIRLEEIERNAIQQALQEHRYNKTKTAAALGITFRALRYKLKKLGIE